MTTETDQIEAEINRSRHALNDTIQELGGKLSPGQILDEALGLAQGQAGKFSANLGRQVRDNPLPVLLIGAGIGMLFMKQRKANGAAYGAQTPATYSTEDWETENRYRDYEAMRAGVRRMEGETEEEYERRLHEADADYFGMTKDEGESHESFKQRVRHAGDSLGKTASGIRRRLGSGFSAVGAGASGAAHAMGAGVTGAAHAMKSGASGAAHAVKAGATGATHFVKGGAQSVKDGFMGAKDKTLDFYEDYPLAAGAVGVAIGALLGACTPLSSTERDRLHGLAGAAARAGADLAEKGARAVHQSSEQARSAIH